MIQIKIGRKGAGASTTWIGRRSVLVGGRH